MEKKFELSENQKAIAMMAGGVAVSAAICYASYKAIAVWMGKAVASELIKAGVVAVAL